MAKDAEKGLTRKAATRTGRWRGPFLRALAETGNVSRSAAAAGVDRQTAYNARKEDDGFAAAWADALEEACDSLELEARRRAVEGTRRFIVSHGKLVMVYRNRRTGQMVNSLDQLRDFTAFTTGRNPADVRIDLAEWEYGPLEEREYSDMLLVQLLKAHRPGKYRENHHVSGDGTAAAPEPITLVLTTPPEGASLIPLQRCNRASCGVASESR